MVIFVEFFTNLPILQEPRIQNQNIDTNFVAKDMPQNQRAILVKVHQS